MKTVSYPPSLIECIKCNKKPGECCTRWEGAPCACMDRVKAAEAKFGKSRYVGNGLYEVNEEISKS